MTVKEWLNRGWKLNKVIQELTEAKERAETLACKITSNTERERVQSSPGNTSERHFINYTEYAQLLNDEIELQMSILKEITETINKVEDNTYRTLLIARYVNFKTWEEIAGEMNYSWKHVACVLHKKALNVIKDVID